MKHILLAISFLFLTSCATVQWKDVFSSTNAIGCLAGGAGGFAMSGSEESTTNRLQTAGIGCAVGGLITHLIRTEAKADIKQDYEEQISELKRRQDMLIKLDGYDMSKEAELRGLYLEDEVIPATINSDGSIDKESVRFRLKKINSDQLLGN